MKRSVWEVYFVFLSLLLTTIGYSQIGIGTVTPESSAVLDLTSANKALLLPRVTNTSAIASPVDGMVVYDISSNCVRFYENGVWGSCLGLPVSVACTGFTGSYCTAALGSATYVVTLSNNDFTAKQVTPATTDLVLSGIAGVSVAAVSPSVTTTINPGASLVVTYAISGTPATVGTLIGTYNKQGLNCSSVVTVTPSTLEVSVASASPITQIGAAMTAITHATTGATDIGTPSGLPPGVTAVWENNTITISGTPTSKGTFNYTIPLVGCGAANATGTITVLCGANIAPGVFKEFSCHNLGADTSLDPSDPVQGIYGNYYQWGRITAVANASTSSGLINGWNTTSAANGSWSDASKTSNDPCPVGFRVPTKSQWDAVLANNVKSWTGTWTNIDTNFGCAINFGPSASEKTLTLPAAGYRGNSDGALFNRGFYGIYWSSTENSAYAHTLYFTSTNAISGNTDRPSGFSVRCVSE